MLIITSLLPLLQDQPHYFNNKTCHGRKIKKITNFLNTSQTPILTAHQPLFVLVKQIQGQWSGIYDGENFVIMLGSFHIEMVSMKLFGYF
jgi:hypothetical protein